MKRFVFPLLLIFILSACAPSKATTNQTQPTSSSSTSNDAATTADLTRTDQQGAVVVEVTPLNLDNPSEQLEFDVAMNTHSVDLSMNLATLATLTTDKGVTVQATTWEGMSGGHHVSGKLIFPATQGGKSILEGANKLTLTITGVDAASRVFEWTLK